ncbi:MAG: hypothetical protein HFJ55_01465 [Clostridia bacterium]|nr:hypothetical protein [Clostridia bacterium]
MDLNYKAEDNLIRDFQEETNTFLDAEKQLKHEEREKLILKHQKKYNGYYFEFYNMLK